MQNQAPIIADKRNEDFKWVERVSTLMDSKFKIGSFRFGLDPILNFIPFAGQAVTFGTSLMLVIVMYRNGVGSKVAVRMLINVMIDAVIGSIPFLGNVFDFFSKANQKNILLLREHYFEGKHQGSAKGILFSLFAILLLVSGFLFYLMWILAEWLFQFINNIF